MNPEALIIGASGQLGFSIHKLLAARGDHVVGTYCKNPIPGLIRLDLTAPDEAAAIVRCICPPVVYLVAAMANVDECEARPDSSFTANVRTVATLARTLGELGSLLVYVSSDYVFNGTDGPYSEWDIPNPICEYGRQKLIAEHAIAFSDCRHIIARSTVIFGPDPQHKNFVLRLVQALRLGHTVRVPIDQLGSPTYGPDLAAALIFMADRGIEGLYHICGPDVLSRFEFAKAVARTFALPESGIQPVLTGDLHQTARRPLRAGMLIDKFRDRTGIDTLGHQTGLNALQAALVSQ